MFAANVISRGAAPGLVPVKSMDCIVFPLVFIVVGEDCENAGELIPVVDDENADDGTETLTEMLRTVIAFELVRVHEIKLYGQIC